MFIVNKFKRSTLFTFMMVVCFQGSGRRALEMMRVMRGRMEEVAAAGGGDRAVVKAAAAAAMHDVRRSTSR